LLVQHGKQSVFLCYFVDAPACFADTVAEFVGAVAEFVGAVLSHPGDDHCRRDKHYVFIDSSLCL
jgi:hypothetical protein